MRVLRPSLHTDASVAVKVPFASSGMLAHPLGLAAGFDKSAHALAGWADLGFSFIEIGTVTPKPQAGNPKPRLFRLPEQKAIINRMGFNNDGFAVVKARLTKFKLEGTSLPVGVNVGKNASTPLDKAVEDYLSGCREFADLADYLVFNISSPNTPGLRSLACPEFVEQLAAGVGTTRKKCWLKLDPDLAKDKFQELVASIGQLGFAGLVLTNTHFVAQPEKGGLSGPPLGAAALKRLEWAWEIHQGKLPMIASGGVMTGKDVLEKLARGAQVVQLYTALVYRGPGAVAQLLRELRTEMQLRGFTSIEQLRGSFYQ